MVTLDNYNDGFLGSSADGQAELIKSMQAGQITGRDTTGLGLTQEPLKAESLEKTLKLLEYRTQDIKLFNALPKLTAYNTVEEFLQLSSYGSERGGFYNEGELSDVEDSTYIRRSELVKYMQVTGEVTMQAQMVKSYVDAMKKEVENKMMWIQRLANRSLTKADAEIIPQEFNSIYKQHASVGLTQDFLYQTFEQYYNSGVVIDLRGGSLKQEDVEIGAVAVDANYGTATSLFAPTTVISGLSQDYYSRQRFFFGGDSAGAFNGTLGVTPRAISTTLGDIALYSDKFMKADASKFATITATSAKAPAAPTVSAVTSVTDVAGKYSGSELGNVYYAVSAINRYGESNLTVFATAITLTEAHGIDISIAATAGANATQGYVIYRTKLTTAGSAAGLEFFPIYKIATSAIAQGHNGAGAGKTRDLGYFLPDTEQAFLTDISDEVMSFKQLAPMSKLDLAVLSMSQRFIVFLFGTPQLYTPKKLVRYINVGRKPSA
jgi:hypothetical protein